MRLTMKDLAKVSKNQNNHLCGYFGHKARIKNKKADRVFLDACNKLKLRYKSMVMAGKSKQCHELGDYLLHSKDQPHTLLIAQAIKFIIEALIRPSKFNLLTVVERENVQIMATPQQEKLINELEKITPKLEAFHESWEKSKYYDEEAEDDLINLPGIVVDVMAFEKDDYSIESIVDDYYKENYLSKESLTFNSM